MSYNRNQGPTSRALLREVDAYAASQVAYAVNGASSALAPLVLSEKLVAWLGLHSFEYKTITAAVSSNAVRRIKVADSLLRILRAMDLTPYSFTDADSVLVGLSRNGWKNCVETTSDARLLAVATLRYIAHYTEKYSGRENAATVCEMLNAWCRPIEKWETLPDPGLLCQHLFGQAWCHFYLPEPTIDRGAPKFAYGLSVIEQIITHHPVFLVGLCTESARFNPQETLPDNLELTL